MGEEEKKPEEKPAVEEKKEVAEKKPEEEAKKPVEEKKKEEGKEKKEEGKEKKEEGKEKKEEKEASPPPPEEIVLKVYMHCEGCARKVRRSLRGFEGVEDVKTDCKSHRVIVMGKNADPVKVYERIQRKSGRTVELISPLPKPKEEKKREDKENVKPEAKKEEPPVIVVVLKVHMHCEGCAQEIKKKIQKMKGVQSVEPDLKSGQVTVKGVFDPQVLAQSIYKRTGKHAVIVKQEPEKKEEGKGEEGKGKEGKEGKEEKKSESGDTKKEKKEGEDGGKGDEETKLDIKKSEFYYIPPYEYEYVHPPQMFSDENPNACSVM